MNEQWKRGLSLFLTLVCLLGVIPLGAFAEVSRGRGFGGKTNALYPEETAVFWAGNPAPALESNGDGTVTYGTMEEAMGQVRQAMVERQTAFTVGVDVSDYSGDKHEIESILFYDCMAHNGNPKEGDSLKWGWRQYYSSYNWIDGLYTVSYEVIYYTNAEQEAQLDAKVEEVLAQLNLWNSTPYEKVKGIYDYLCSNIVYDYSDDIQRYSSYKGLVHGTCVCQGYSMLFYRMALTLGLEARMISGYDGTGESHGWNIVNLYGEFYNLDATWDAGEGVYYCFLKSPENFPNHYRKPEYDDEAFHGEYPMAETDYSPDKEKQGQYTVYRDEWGNVTGIDVEVYVQDNVVAKIADVLPVVQDFDTAPVINVTMPEGASLELDLTMEDARYGNVFAFLNEDGGYTVYLDTEKTDTGVNITVYRSMELVVADNSRYFYDIPQDFWAEDAIDYMSGRRLLLGKNDGSFGPFETITRKTVALLLYRIEGQPEVSGQMAFSDVQRDIYYDAILWASQVGITNGYTDGTFRPNGVITRQQFAAMLYRYAAYLGITLECDSARDVTACHDYGQLASWAKDPAQWVYQLGIITGRSDGSFDPGGNTTRGQLAVIMMRFLQKYFREY